MEIKPPGLKVHKNHKVCETVGDCHMVRHGGNTTEPVAELRSASQTQEVQHETESNSE